MSAKVVWLYIQRAVGSKRPFPHASGAHEHSHEAASQIVVGAVQLTPTEAGVGQLQAQLGNDEERNRLDKKETG